MTALKLPLLSVSIGLPICAIGPENGNAWPWITTGTPPPAPLTRPNSATPWPNTTGSGRTPNVIASLPVAV